MSDPDARPDPMDKAYVEAEAVLDDEDARAARRARALAAVAQEPAAPAPSARRPAWRPARWWAAACVAGLGLLAVTQIYEPARRQTPIAPAPTPAAEPSAGRQGAVAPATSAPPAPTVSVAPPASAPAIAKAAPPSPPPALAMPPAPEAFPAAAAPPPPPPPPPSGVVAEQRERDEVAADQTQRGAAMQAPAARLAAPLAAPTGAESLGGAPPSPAARLRAAAAAGRTAEVEALLAQGVPVDAPDADGDTALMRSIQADHPAAAALLRRHGASLDRKNHAGESAKDMARAKGDAELDRAIGLAR